MQDTNINIAAAAHPPEAISNMERRIFLAAQIAYTATKKGLDIYEMNAVVSLGVTYLDYGYTAASAYEQAVKTIDNVLLMNQLIEKRRAS